MSRSPSTTSPKVGIALPGDWVALTVPSSGSQLEAQVDAYVAAHPDKAGERDALCRVLARLTTPASGIRLLFAAVTPVVVDGIVAPVSLTLTATPPTGVELTPSDQSAVTEGSHGRFDIVSVDLPCGPAVRVEQLQHTAAPPDAAAGGASDTEIVSHVVQYLVPVGTRHTVVLTFTTPALALGERLRGLFHTIARTLSTETA